MQFEVVEANIKVFSKLPDSETRRVNLPFGVLEAWGWKLATPAKSSVLLIGLCRYQSQKHSFLLSLTSVHSSKCVEFFAGESWSLSGTLKSKNRARYTTP